MSEANRDSRTVKTDWRSEAMDPRNGLHEAWLRPEPDINPFKA